MEKTAVYELVDHSKGGKVIATFWWDGRNVKCDDKQFLEGLKTEDYTRYRNNETWLHELPRIFKNGYLMARKARNH